MLNSQFPTNLVPLSTPFCVFTTGGQTAVWISGPVRCTLTCTLTLQQAAHTQVFVPDSVRGICFFFLLVTHWFLMPVLVLVVFLQREHLYTDDKEWLTLYIHFNTSVNTQTDWVFTLSLFYIVFKTNVNLYMLNPAVMFYKSFNLCVLLLSKWFCSWFSTFVNFSWHLMVLPDFRYAINCCCVCRWTS